MNNYDVIIVGGGPAGSTAAYYLGQKGIKTLLIDKAKFPRDKVCGGGISTRALLRFPYLEKKLESVSINWVNRVYIESPAGFSVEYKASDPLYLMIKRDEFDFLLFKLAKERVDVLEKSLVTNVEVTSQFARVILKDGRCVHCKIVVGADGVNSIVARDSGLNKTIENENYAIVMREETPTANLDVKRPQRDTMYVYYGIQGHYGYGYVFPKLSFLNVGIGFRLDYFKNKIGQDAYKYYSAFLDKLKSDNHIKGDSLKEYVASYTLPVGGPLERTFADRILLCGDAGGFVNAFTAEGIYYAMITGEYSAKIAEEAIKTNDLSKKKLGIYEKLWKKEIGLELKRSVRIQKTILNDPSRIDKIIKAAQRDPKLADILARYSTGSIDYYNCDSDSRGRFPIMRGDALGRTIGRRGGRRRRGG